MKALTSATARPKPDTMKSHLLRIQALPAYVRHLSVLHPHDTIRILIDSAVVRDDNDTALVGQNMVPDEFHDVATGVAIERGRRLVENQNFRTTDNGSGDGDGLLLPPPGVYPRQGPGTPPADQPKKPL